MCVGGGGGRGVIRRVRVSIKREPVWPSGKALLVRPVSGRRGFDFLASALLFSSKVVVGGHCRVGRWSEFLIG